MEYSLCLCIFFGETKTNLHDSTKEYLSAKLNGMELITVLGTIVYIIRGQAAPWRTGIFYRCIIYLFHSRVMNSLSPDFQKYFTQRALCSKEGRKH